MPCATASWPKLHHRHRKPLLTTEFEAADSAKLRSELLPPSRSLCTPRRPSAPRLERRPFELRATRGAAVDDEPSPCPGRVFARMQLLRRATDQIRRPWMAQPLTTKPLPLLRRPDHRRDRIWTTDAGTTAEFLAIDPSAIVILYIHAVLLTCFQGEASTLTRLVLYFLSYLHVPCSHIGHELHTIVLYHCSLLVSHCSLWDWGKY
ncbi:hypothetical protein M6B38_340965 [Iris pallida]|uniref:Uncharacterized protein n=1 Tax=Iris pallida TaxID=29817 RepID=A0AAX6GXT0_IRIPA|nr:hypothetical protein M6B38_340965 [Iris pallida]